MKNVRMTICMMILFVAASSSYGGITTYTDLSAFDADSHASIVDDFTGEGWEFVGTGVITNFSTPYATNGITYTNLIGDALGIVIKGDTAGDHYLIESQSRSLTVSGNEDFTLDFANETHAVGFDSYANGLGPLMVTFFGEDGVLESFEISHDPYVVGFFGAVSDEPIVSMRWTATGGERINTGIARIRTDTIPEPASLLLLSLGGLALRRRRN